MENTEEKTIEETKTIVVTDHAYERAKERMSLNIKSFDRLAEKVFNEGVTHADTKGQLKKYVSSLFLQYRTAGNIRIYGEYVYVFAGNTLITLYQLPNELRKYVKLSTQKNEQ